MGEGRGLRRVIEVVKKGGAVGVRGFAATRRPTASKERRITIVSVWIMRKVGDDDNRQSVRSKSTG